MKKLLLSLFIFLMLCSSAYALDDTVERYPTGAITDYWTQSGTSSYYYPTVITYLDSTSHVISLHGNTASIYDFFSEITSENADYSNYFSFTVRKLYATSTVNGSTGSIKLSVTLSNSTTGYSNKFDVLTVTSIPSTYSLLNSTIEVFSLNGRIYLYRDGVQIADEGTAPTVPCKVTVRLDKTMTSGQILTYCYVDDLSTVGSTIGTPETWNELFTNLTYTTRIQAYSSYPTSTYKVTLYSLSNTENAGQVYTQTITKQSDYISFNRESTIDLNFGLYVLELTRDSDILRDEYFYYEQSSSPQGLPEILFLGESDVSTEIRDEDNNGGEISGGGSVYLYPDVQADGTYDFTYDILETPFSIKTELTNIYNNTAITSTTLSYSGLSTQTYNVSIDGAPTASTGGADTYSYTFSDWGTATNHLVSFSLDYSRAGVWGEVKNSETQEGIKSATVSVSGENFSKTIYTDENGLYYLTKGIEAGKTYTISVSKTGYSTPPSQTALTTDGSTTRQDFYMDKTSTDGSGLYYAPHDVGFTVLEYWYSGSGLTGVTYAIYNGTEQIKTGSTDSKGMFTGSDMKGGTNYTITLTYNGKIYTEYVEPSLTEYVFVLNKEGILHQYVNSWLTLHYTENSQNVTIAYESNKTLSGASLTVIAGNGTTVYTQTLVTQSGTFIFETGGEGDYNLHFHIETIDGSTASQSWGLSYPDGIPLFPDSYPAWLKNVLFSGIVMVFLLAFGKSKNDVACGAVAILTSMGYLFGWFTGSLYFVAIVWLIAIGAAFLHYKRTGGIG